VIKDVWSKVRAVCSAVENHSIDDLDRFDEPRTGLILACCLRVLFYYELLPKFLTKSASDQHVERASDTRKKPQAGLIAEVQQFPQHYFPASAMSFHRLISASGAISSLNCRSCSCSQAGQGQGFCS
jgi:hypothetical protein